MVETVVPAVKRYPVIFIHPAGIIEVIDDAVRDPAVIRKFLLVDTETHYCIITCKPIGKIEAVYMDIIPSQFQLGLSCNEYFSRGLGFEENWLFPGAIAIETDGHVVPFPIFQDNDIAGEGPGIGIIQFGDIFYYDGTGWWKKAGQQHAYRQ